MMRTVRDIPVFANIPILVRAPLNVPVGDGTVTSNYRLRRAVPTIRFLSERGAKVVLISHIEGAGLPAGRQGTETLAPVAEALGTLVSGVSFFGETVGERARAAVRALAPGNVLVLENLRRNRGEKMNDRAFAHELAALADVFVQDSFDTCHRRHASIIGVPELLPSYAGLLLDEEVRELSRALTPESPSLAVIGGMKFSTKEPALVALSRKYDKIFVGGALASDFLKAAGQEVGESLVSEHALGSAEELLASHRLVLPVDSLVVPASLVGSSDAPIRARVALAGQIRPDESILDHGPDTTALLARLAEEAKTILWNGPLGNYENGFTNATNDFARVVAESGARSVVGGGDTVAAIEGLGLLPHFSFVSTGGGAMLAFLAKGTLPGIEALGTSDV